MTRGNSIPDMTGRSVEEHDLDLLLILLQNDGDALNFIF
jgi:hypothetical protein